MVTFIFIKQQCLQAEVFQIPALNKYKQRLAKLKDNNSEVDEWQIRKALGAI